MDYEITKWLYDQFFPIILFDKVIIFLYKLFRIIWSLKLPNSFLVINEIEQCLVTCKAQAALWLDLIHIQVLFIIFRIYLFDCALTLIWDNIIYLAIGR